MAFRILTLILALSAVAVAEPAKELVVPAALANVSAIKPGEPFTVGILLHIEPDWHIYWQNPGDSGRPTSVKFSLPPGFTAGPLQFPVPTKFMMPGDVVLYGYAGDVLLTARITPPKDLPKGSSPQITAKVSWLVCSDVCVPGKASLDLTLPVVDASVPANAEVFSTWQDRFPVEPSQADALANLTQQVTPVAKDGMTSDAIGLSFFWAQTPKLVEFFPGPLEHFVISDITVKTTGSLSQVSFTARPLAGQNPVSTTMPSVLAYTDDAGQRRGVTVQVDVPQPR